MAGFKFLGVLLGLTVAVVGHAEGIKVAEFRADANLLPDPARFAPAGGRGLYGSGSLYSEETGGIESRSWSFGPYTFSGVMNWEHRPAYQPGDVPYVGEEFFSMGSSLAIGESSETRFYHGRSQAVVAPDLALYGLDDEGAVSRTGIAQSLYFADPDARVGLGYEYASGDRELSYEGLEGHQISLSGEIQIGWGFDARLQAGYGLYSYSEYEGVRGDLNSARTNMRAGISRSFTPSLTWGMHYSYVDEEFDVSDLSQSRRTWGLNLEYRY